MLDATIVMAHRWLQDPEYGLQQMLQGLPTPILDAVHLYNEVEDEELMTEEGPVRVPAVMVLGATDVEYDPGRKVWNTSVIDIFCMFAGGTDWPLSRTSILGGKILRAVGRSLRRMGINRHREERNFGVLDEVEIVEVQRVIQQRIAGRVAGVPMSGAVLASILVKDLAP